LDGPILIIYFPSTLRHIKQNQKIVPQPHDFEQSLALHSSQIRTLCEIVEDLDLNAKHIDGFEFLKYTHHNCVQSWEHKIFYTESTPGTGHLVSLDGEGCGCMDEACEITV
jgi:hypothetical protein